MTIVKAIKTLLIGVWLVGGLVWASASSFSEPAETVEPVVYNQEDYVGSETCRSCHEGQFGNFAKTKHASIPATGQWKGKVQGCESCHGPGKLHVDGGGDKSKIRTFANEGAKQISETCLSCHAGKEEHNNYRRGEHWRNDVGCTDCHSPHSAQPEAAKTGSLTLISPASRQKPDTSSLRMLRTSEPQLCLQCHNEARGQFTMPFHHKVLEGAVKCSDCHNAHGGFELKQTRLATGADGACLKCHTDKQGPFLFEHAPLKVEGCATCHMSHGASNPKLLKRNEVRQLCLECHTNTHEIGAPNTPSFHNQATARFQNCTTCHLKIHGSQNHRFFFR
jgi:predicted CXXCH cytochrome family protein